jgi:hypothetical protein
MCELGQPYVPATAADAVAMAQAGLAWMAGADVASMPAPVQGDCLAALERADSMHIAARAKVLAAFHAGNGCQDDGHGSAKMWLRWQTRVTKGAAAAAMAWMRRLAAHPAVGDALAAGELSGSWARQVCGWTDLLPAECRADADAILLAAAADGADLADLAALAAMLAATGPCNRGRRSSISLASRGFAIHTAMLRCQVGRRSSELLNVLPMPASAMGPNVSVGPAAVSTLAPGR